MQIFGKTEIGKVRTDNQDRYLFGTLNDGAIFSIVCDGMGGVSGGSVASDIAIKAIVEDINNKFNIKMTNNEIKQLCFDAINIANSIVYEISSKEKALSGMGTTVVLTIIIENIAHIVHIGDSRAYLIKNNEVKQLTRDHSFVQEMVDLGKLTKQDAKTHPKKNIITRALGVSKHIEAEYTNIEFEENDVLLICTDGLINHINEDEFINLIVVNDLQRTCDKLVELALDRGGNDNITLVLLSK